MLLEVFDKNYKNNNTMRITFSEYIYDNLILEVVIKRKGLLS